MNAQRLKNFQNAVDSLEEYLAAPVVVKRDLAGIVFGFSIAFELAWKCVQDKTSELGYSERGPKPAISAGLQAGLIPISKETVWSEMLADRNSASHIYDQKFAEALVGRIRLAYMAALSELVKALSVTGN